MPPASLVVEGSVLVSAGRVYLVPPASLVAEGPALARVGLVSLMPPASWAIVWVPALRGEVDSSMAQAMRLMSWRRWVRWA